MRRSISHLTGPQLLIWSLKKYHRNKHLIHKFPFKHKTLKHAVNHGDAVTHAGGIRTKEKLTRNARDNCLGGIDHFSTLASIISRTSWKWNMSSLVYYYNLFTQKKLESVQFCVTIFDIINPFHEVYHEKKPMILENRMRW